MVLVRQVCSTSPPAPALLFTVLLSQAPPRTLCTEPGRSHRRGFPKGCRLCPPKPPVPSHSFTPPLRSPASFLSSGLHSSLSFPWLASDQLDDARQVVCLLVDSKSPSHCGTCLNFKRLDSVVPSTQHRFFVLPINIPFSLITTPDITLPPRHLRARDSHVRHVLYTVP